MPKLAMTFLRVAAYAPQGVTALGLGTVGAVFGARPGLPAFDLSLCTDEPGPVRTDLGVPVRIEHGLDALADSELVVVLPSSQYRGAEDSEVGTALRAATARGATLAAHCTGVFLLAAAGLLDGLEVTTHWQFVDELTATYPRIRIRPEALYVIYPVPVPSDSTISPCRSAKTRLSAAPAISAGSRGETKVAMAASGRAPASVTRSTTRSAKVPVP